MGTSQIATSLKRRPYGAAQVLWRAAGGDEQWAVVRLGNTAGQTEFYGTLAAELIYQGYADATLSYAGETHTQRVYDLLLGSGGSLTTWERAIG